MPVKKEELMRKMIESDKKSSKHNSMLLLCSSCHKNRIQLKQHRVILLFFFLHRSKSAELAGKEGYKLTRKGTRREGTQQMSDIHLL